MSGQILEIPVFANRGGKADASRLGYIGRSPLDKARRDSDSWFTPPLYLNSVRKVMGHIDLDPFTSDVANKIVGAEFMLSEKKSAFDHDWDVKKNTRVFMNPPYSAGLCGKAVTRFIDQYEARNFVEGIVLVNNATDTRWFNALVQYCDAICFTNHRISFWNADHKSVSGNTRGQAFFYFSRNKKKLAKFAQVFSKHGFVVQPLK